MTKRTNAIPDSIAYKVFKKAMIGRRKNVKINRGLKKIKHINKALLKCGSLYNITILYNDIQN